MAANSYARRWVVLLVLAFVLMIAISPAASVLFWAILVPFWLFFFGGLISVLLSARRLTTTLELGPSPFFSVLSSRAPPVAW